MRVCSLLGSLSTKAGNGLAFSIFFFPINFALLT